MSIAYLILSSLLPGSSLRPENVDVKFSTLVFTKLAFDLKYLFFHKYLKKNTYKTRKKIDLEELVFDI